MVNPLAMAVGEHLLLSDPVIRWEALFSDTNPPSVVLTASVRSGPQPPIFPVPDYGATTLAVQMDARVAIELYEKLGALGRSMGWLPQK
jgi:hypothetical protein